MSCIDVLDSMRIRPCRIDLTLKVMSLYIHLLKFNPKSYLQMYVYSHLHTVWRSVTLLYIIIIRKSFDLGRLQKTLRRVILHALLCVGCWLKHNPFSLSLDAEGKPGVSGLLYLTCCNLGMLILYLIQTL